MSDLITKPEGGTADVPGTGIPNQSSYTGPFPSLEPVLERQVREVQYQGTREFSQERYSDRYTFRDHYGSVWLVEVEGQAGTLPPLLYCWAEQLQPEDVQEMLAAIDTLRDAYPEQGQRPSADESSLSDDLVLKVRIELTEERSVSPPYQVGIRIDPYLSLNQSTSYTIYGLGDGAKPFRVGHNTNEGTITVIAPGASRPSTGGPGGITGFVPSGNPRITVRGVDSSNTYELSGALAVPF